MMVTRSLRSMTRALIFLCVPLSVASCIYRFKAPTEFSFDSSKSKIIPLRAALFIRPGYRNFMIGHPAKLGGFYPIEYALGESFMTGSRRIAELLFRDVVFFETMNAETDLPDIDVIVVPEITEGKFYSFGRKSLAARIEVKWTILDRGRKEIYVNTFVGEATGKEKPFLDQNKELGRLMDAAVIEVYHKAVESLGAVEWWKDIIK